MTPGLACCKRLIVRPSLQNMLADHIPALHIHGVSPSPPPTTQKPAPPAAILMTVHYRVRRGAPTDSAGADAMSAAKHSERGAAFIYMMLLFVAASIVMAGY